MSRLKSSRVRDSQVESRQSHLNRDSWTFCKGFREVRGHVPSEKMRNWRPSNCWKYIEIVNPTTTTLILYHFGFFTIPSGGPSWLLGGGGGCVRTPRTSLPTGLRVNIVRVELSLGTSRSSRDFRTRRRESSATYTIHVQENRDI